MEKHCLFILCLVISAAATNARLKYRKHHKHDEVISVNPSPDDPGDGEGSVESHHEERQSLWAVPKHSRHHEHVRRKHKKRKAMKKQEGTEDPLVVEWKELTGSVDPEVDLCQTLTCKRKEVCLYDAEAHTAECIHRRVLRLRKKLKRMGVLDEAHESNAIPNRLLSRHHAARPHANGHVEHMNKKVHKLDKSQNEVVESHKVHKCSRGELHEMGRRLLDWFKLLQDDYYAREGKGHVKVKRNSRKKELHDDGSCPCQAPVSWQFGQLDQDSNGQLSVAELGDIESNLYEPCVTPYLNTCDPDGDLEITEQEWCCCYAGIMPPCLNAQKKILGTERANPVSMPGLFIPTCDSDGYYQRMQCHGSLGQCWCVDRTGHEIPKTRVLGAADCTKFTGRYTGHPPVK